MITFKPIIKKGNKRADGTWKVYIRVTRNKDIRFISTSLYVNKKDITSTYKIKNQQVLDHCEDTIRWYRKKVADMNLEMIDLSIDKIVELLQRKDADSCDISFSDYFQIWCERTKIKGVKNYVTAYRTLVRFMGRNEIYFSDITIKSLTEFAEFLSEKPRAMSLYASSIVKVFNDGKVYYSGEDGNSQIKHSIDAFKVPKQNVAEKRALTIEEIKSIFACPYDNLKVKGLQSRHDLALDCFRLSFCLMGMNSADLFSATEREGDTITYYRQKTRDRRNDKAKIVIDIPSTIKPLVEKYADDERVFNFHRRFGSEVDLNRAINIGLKQVDKEIGIEKLQFYAARHSMATIAVNDVGIPPYVVNEMLNHVDSSMRITELYIKKSFKRINDANKELMKFVFGE